MEQVQTIFSLLNWPHAMTCKVMLHSHPDSSPSFLAIFSNQMGKGVPSIPLTCAASPTYSANSSMLIRKICNRSTKRHFKHTNGRGSGEKMNNFHYQIIGAYN